MGKVNNKKLDVSIIIVNYNSLNLLENCLDSVIKYSQDIEYEIIVVDNHSTEGDIKSTVNKFKDITLIINRENVGFAKANNQGVKIANGKYVLFLNNDTVFKENSLKAVFDFAESINKDTIIGCKLLNSDLTVQISFAEFPSLKNAFTSYTFLYKIFPRSKHFNKYYLSLTEIKKPLEVDYVTGAFLFCKTSSFERIAGFDERFFFFSEEIDLCYRFKNFGGKVYYIPHTSIIHLGGGTAKVDSWFTFKNKAISLIQFYQKHRNKFNYAFFLVIHSLGVILRLIVSLTIGITTMDRNYMKRGYYYIKLLFVYPKNNFK